MHFFFFGAVYGSISCAVYHMAEITGMQKCLDGLAVGQVETVNVDKYGATGCPVVEFAMQFAAKLAGCFL